MSFRIATLNVHSWADADYEDNIERVVALVKEHQPDVICFQESHRQGQFKFNQQMPQYQHCFLQNRCSILSKYPAEELYSKEKRNAVTKFGSFVTAKVQLPNVEKPVIVTCLHLNFRTEPLRHEEVDAIRKLEAPLFDSNASQIWTGDFNALTREDYSESQWNDLTSVRARNSWELPKTSLTTKVKNFGFADCWTLAGKPEPIKTCRFGTHIDYIYAAASLFDNFKLISVQHIDDRASDHNMVLATFDKKN